VVSKSEFMRNDTKHPWSDTVLVAEDLLHAIQLAWIIKVVISIKVLEVILSCKEIRWEVFCGGECGGGGSILGAGRSV
jgi:hypothetical protein